MNESELNSLVDQVFDQCQPDWPGFKQELTKNGSLYLHVFAEKFAELLIKKCGELCDNKTFDDEGCCFGLEDMLSKHFGVEK